MTSLEWFYNELIEHKIIKKEKHFSFVKNFATTYELLFEHAKRMHKNEITSAYFDGAVEIKKNHYIEIEDYYQKTFGSKDINGNEIEFAQTLKNYHIVDANEMVDELIGFQLYLNNKGLINNHDWDFEKIAKKYIKSLKQPKTI